MYSNVVSQEEAVESLCRDIASDELPRSILFEGPAYSAKLTTALETARVLSCERTTPAEPPDIDRETYVPWDCDCPSCRRHRILAHPDLLVIGPRAFRPEIAAAGAALVTDNCVQTRYLFLRSCRKLLKRFDFQLFAHEEPRLTKAMPSVRALEELSDSIDPSRPAAVAEGKKTAKAVAEALALAEKLESLVASTTPVFMIRAAENWARLAPNGKRKTVIIENADRMLDSSRNALLKVLEEPPETAEFILTTSRRGAMIQTVLSRVRSYRFARRPPAVERGIISRVFKSGFESGLDRFFTQEMPTAGSGLQLLADRFADSVCAEAETRNAYRGAFLTVGIPGESPESVLAEAKAATGAFGASDDSYEYSFIAFLGSLSWRLRELARSAVPDELDALARWNAAIRDAQTGYESFNLPPNTLADRMLESLRRSS
ncbi:MAG: hypothetical protein NT080_13295 [Spirochaetes bacterium]|nr:hypothetical protein [Spirochaetota bacterium]